MLVSSVGAGKLWSRVVSIVVPVAELLWRHATVHVLLPLRMVLVFREVPHIPDTTAGAVRSVSRGTGTRPRPSTRIAWAGGHVGDGLSTTNLAGRTLVAPLTGH